MENSNLIGFPKKDYKILSENCKYVRDLLQEPSMKEFMWKSAGKTPDGKRIEEEKLKLCPRINHLTISEISESIPEDEKSIYLPDVMIDLNLTIPYPTKSDPEISTTCKEAVQFFLDLIDLFEISGKLNLEELEEVRKVREKVFSDLNEKEEGLKRKREKERLEKLKKDDIDRLSKMDEEERSKVIRKRNERKIKKQMLKKSGSRLVG